MSKITDERLEFGTLREANVARQRDWCPDQLPDLSFRGNELAGETGEVCNVIKKLERERLGWRGSRDTVAHLAEELGDVVICADLVAISAGIDLDAAVAAKFNATSEKVGLPHRITELRALRSKSEAVAWLVYVAFPPDGDGPRYEVASPDEDGAFPVYTHPAPQEAVGVKGLDEALHHQIDEYWRIAWREGSAGRVHDNENNDASRVRAEIDRLISTLTHPAPATGVSDALAALKAVEADAVSIGGGQSAISDETRTKVEKAIAALTEEGA